MVASRIFALALISALLTLAAGVQAASAATTTVSYNSAQNKLVISAGSGDENSIEIDQSGSTYTISEQGENVGLTAPASGCSMPVNGVTSCNRPNLALIEVSLGGPTDGTDSLDATEEVVTNMTVDGDTGDDFITTGSGNDTINGGNENPATDGSTGDVLYGGPGNDLLNGQDGEDDLDGAEGNDQLTGGANDDLLEGGEGDDRFVASSGLDGADSISDWDGSDTADYSERGNTQLSLSNDLVGNDGATGEGDFIDPGVETMIGAGGVDTLTGGGELNILQGRGGNDNLVGGSGISIADYSNATSSQSVSVDLGAQTMSLLAGSATGINSDSLTQIEGAFGGAGDDILTGSMTDNVLRGNAGSDRLDGQAGTDTADYGNAAAMISLDLGVQGTPQNTNSMGQDNLDGMENVNGGSAGDVLTGDDQDNKISGNGGSDTINASGGDDIVDAGNGDDTVNGGTGDNELAGDDGSDTITFAGSPVGADVSLMNFGAERGDESDLVYDFEHVVGSSHADTIEGSAEDNVLDGAGGVDRLDYSNSFDGVAVSLGKTGPQNTGGAGTDTISGFEDLGGSEWDDTLTGSTGVNAIYGLDGDDTINTRDAAGDEIDCGDGDADIAVLDQLDSPLDCEDLDVLAPPPPPDPVDTPPAGDASNDIDDSEPVQAAKVGLGSKSVKMSRSGLIKLALTCPADAEDGCLGSLTISAKGKIGSARFARIAPGKRTTVTIKLSAKAKKTVTKKRKLAATVKISSASMSGGESQSTTQKLTIKR